MSPVDRAPEFLVGELIGGTPAGLVSKRVYATNQNLDRTWRSLSGKYAITEVKGGMSFTLPAFEKYSVQFYASGKVSICGGLGKDDEAILVALKDGVVTTDGQPFTWRVTKRQLGSKELQAQVRSLSQAFADYATQYHATA
jgi:hypothetical protein